MNEKSSNQFSQKLFYWFPIEFSVQNFSSVSKQTNFVALENQSLRLSITFNLLL